MHSSVSKFKLNAHLKRCNKLKTAYKGPCFSLNVNLISDIPCGENIKDLLIGISSYESAMLILNSIELDVNNTQNQKVSCHHKVKNYMPPNARNKNLIQIGSMLSILDENCDLNQIDCCLEFGAGKGMQMILRNMN